MRLLPPPKGSGFPSQNYIMNKEQIMASFWAFHINAFNSILYMFRSNFWFVLILAGAVLFTVLSVKEEMQFIAVERQRFL